jgi:TRAP-type transport system periplasmic protein
VQAWRDAAAPLLDAWKADVAAKGADPDAIHDALIQSLKDHGALYQ